MKQEIITVFGKRYKAVAKFHNREADMIEIEPLTEVDELKFKIDSLESKIGEINSKLDTFTMIDSLNDKIESLESKIKALETMVRTLMDDEEEDDTPLDHLSTPEDDGVNDLIAHCKPMESF